MTAARDELRRITQAQREAEERRAAAVAAVDAIDARRDDVERVERELAAARKLGEPTAELETELADLTPISRAEAQAELTTLERTIAGLEPRLHAARRAVAAERVTESLTAIDAQMDVQAVTAKRFVGQLQATIASVEKMTKARGQVDELQREAAQVADAAGLEPPPRPDETWTLPDGWETLVEFLQAGPFMPNAHRERAQVWSKKQIADRQQRWETQKIDWAARQMITGYPEALQRIPAELRDRATALAAELRAADEEWLPQIVHDDTDPVIELLDTPDAREERRLVGEEERQRLLDAQPKRRVEVKP